MVNVKERFAICKHCPSHFESGSQNLFALDRTSVSKSMKTHFDRFHLKEDHDPTREGSTSKQDSFIRPSTPIIVPNAENEKECANLAHTTPIVSRTLNNTEELCHLNQGLDPKQVNKEDLSTHDCC